MRTIAIINQKGGCGKTTVAVNLAAVLAARGCRTVLVDMDPQSHCALGLAVPESQIDRSICDVLRAGLDGSTTFSDIVWQISRNLDLAPSTMALAGVEAELTSAPDKDRRLLQVLSNIDDDDEEDSGEAARIRKAEREALDLRRRLFTALRDPIEAKRPTVKPPTKKEKHVMNPLKPLDEVSVSLLGTGGGSTVLGSRRWS